MTISNRLIVSLAIISIVIALISLYLNEEQYSSIQRGATVQFEVGITVREKSAPKTLRQRIQETFRGLFRKFSPPPVEKNA